MLLLQLQATARRLKRLTVQHDRYERDRQRDDKRQWVQDRRARTRHLIELGGLVQKAGLVELVDDDRATLLGAFLEIAGRLRQPEDASHQEHEHERSLAPETERHTASAADLRTRWRRRGLRAFEAAAAELTAG
jgi:hypothetical protein